MPTRAHRWPTITTIVIGLGLLVAPFVFQMFDRAPKGGDMIDEFRPYMTQERVDTFRGYLRDIGDANAESTDRLPVELASSGALDETEYATTMGSITRLNEGWPAIDADMSDLLARMEANFTSYDAVAALPPFKLFPWFFVLPGAAIAGVAGSAFRASGRGERPVRRWWTLVAVGVAVAAAPAVFQMFDRAPQGRDMIDDFRPMMTRARVQNVQGYFITLGAAEGQLRTKAIPLLAESGGDPADFPAIGAFSDAWPTIVSDFNPMVATMSDNVDNFEAVDALPSFALFPWFFVVPGLLVAGLAIVALRSGRTPSAPAALPSSD